MSSYVEPSSLGSAFRRSPTLNRGSIVPGNVHTSNIGGHERPSISGDTAVLTIRPNVPVPTSMGASSAMEEPLIQSEEDVEGAVLGTPLQKRLEFACESLQLPDRMELACGPPML